MSSIIEEIANFERSIGPKESERILFEELKQFSEYYQCSFHHYRRKTTDVVYVLDASGNQVTYGLGKGVFSKIGAYGECLEHFLYRDIGRKGSTPVPMNEFKESEVSKQDAVLHYASKLSGVPKTIDCIEFERIHDRAKLFVPSTYVNYHFLDHNNEKGDFEIFMGRYVTTSGAAFALTEDDAFLHALNESLERDTTSEFFLKIFQKESSVKSSFHKLDLDNMPEYLAERVQIVHDLHKPTSIEVYISKTVFDVWWSICVIRFDKSSMIVLPQFGAGCSVLYDLAIYRAISECLQMLDNYGGSNCESDTKFLAFTEKFPKFKNIAFLETENIFEERKYDNSNNNNHGMPVKQQIEHITTAMHNRKFYPSKHVSHSAHDFYLLCSYTPNLERFYNITKSMPVLPINYIVKRLSS